MAPFDTLRHEARALTVRAGTALVVFLAIAIALLGVPGGPLATAEAGDKADTPGAAYQTSGTAWGDSGTTSGEEPVLGSDWGDDDSAGPPPSEGPSTEQSSHEWQESHESTTNESTTNESTTNDSTTDESESNTSATNESSASATNESTTNQSATSNSTSNQSATNDSPSDEPGDDEPVTPQKGEPTSGGDKTGDKEQAPEVSSRNQVSPPSGGSKDDEEPVIDPDVTPEPEPEPSSRTQTSSDSTSTEPTGGGDIVTLPGEGGQAPAAAPAGSGVGALRDTLGGGTTRAGAHSAQFDNGGEGSGPVDGGITSSIGGGGNLGSTASGGLGGTLLADAGTSADQPAGAGDGSSGGAGKQKGGSGEGEPNVVTNTVNRIVRVVPDSLKVALAALAALSALLGFGYLLAAVRARRLARQRRELLQEVGLLQTALLPPVPERVGSLRTSVAYRPADGPGAGGDFYDVLALPGGRVGFILGDVSGHGRGALARTAFMRYTLRAYLEAGLEPRVALQVAGRVIDDNLGGDFATVLLAVHDPETGSLTYATAGHPAPIVVGAQPHDPVTAASSPPIGVGVRTGLRQTTVPLVPGSVACLFTDGLMEARTDEGILGRERLTELVDEIRDEASARRLIERVAAEANVRSDDMAAVVVTPTAGVTAGLFRTEQLELSARELEGPIARRFLEACGFSEVEVEDAEREAWTLAGRFGGVVLHVVFGNRLRVEVLPRNVESIEAASRRVSAGSPQ